jgi:hypothetical protein
VAAAGQGVGDVGKKEKKKKKRERGRVLRTFHLSSLSSKPGNEYFIRSGVHQQICKEPECSPANRQFLHVR